MKNKQTLSAGNGVSVSYKVNVNERIKIPFFNEIALTLLVTMTCVGAIMTFVTILNFSVIPGVVIAAIAAFSVVYTILYKLIKKRRALVIVGTAVLAGLVFCLFFKELSKGVVFIYDQSKATVSSFMFWEQTPPTYEWQYEFLKLTNAVTVLLSMLLCSAISYFTVVKQSFIAVFLLTFPFFEIGAAFGAVPNYLCFSLLLASWASALTLSGVANAKIKMRHSNGEKQKAKIGGNKQRFAGVAVVAAATVFVLFSCITAHLNTIGFSRAENIDKLRNDTKYAFEDFVDYITGKDHDGSLKEGKLDEVEDRIIKHRHYITMETDISSTEEPIKLKGYTATIYKNNRWNQTDEYEQYQTMFDGFDESTPLMGNNTGRLITSSSRFAGQFFVNITLSDFRRKKSYAYAPYYASFTAEYTAIYDSYVAPTSKSRYSYPAYLWEDYLYMVPDSAVYKTDEYQAAFAQYTEFVKQEYVKSQTTESVKALAMSFEASDKFEYINALRPYLQKNMEYTLKSGKCPADADFVEQFLFNTKAGYSTHFATAAAVLLQARGYAARYVEGYYIPAEVFNSTPSDRLYGFKTIDITDEYAHAWIEVFDETYGWIPVEVTPGFWSGDLRNPSKPTPPPPPEEDTPPSSDGDLSIDFEIVEDEVDNTVEEEPFQPKKSVSGRVIVPILLAVTVVTICARYGASVFIKRRMYASRNVNQKLKFAYRQLVRLAAYQKIGIDNVRDYRALARRIGDGGYITAERLYRVFHVLLKHAYSRTPATLEEADEVLSELRAYSRAIYDDLSKPKKMVYKYLRNLY